MRCANFADDSLEVIKNMGHFTRERRDAQVSDQRREQQE